MHIVHLGIKHSDVSDHSAGYTFKGILRENPQNEREGMFFQVNQFVRADVDTARWLTMFTSMSVSL